MAKKLHCALLVPQKAPRRFACSAIITKETFSFALQTVVVILLLNNNDDRNYRSTILHVKVRTKYAEVNILKKEVAIKLNIQLAS